MSAGGVDPGVVRRTLVVAVALLVLVGSLVARPPAVLAACAVVPPPPDEAVLFGDVVFVGTVLRTENQGRWATVRVEERWKGARDLAETIQVHGGPDPGTATDVDRAYLPGRYLFVVEHGAAALADSACSGTTRWTDALSSLRPPGVSPAAVDLPTDPLGSIDPAEIALVAALLIALLVSIVAYLWVLRARRRPPDWIR